jgi:threonine dehydrogenase-like Zn-dependent dehydrogenase
MKALVYNGPRDVAVKHMPNPKIKHPGDVLVKITTTNICGLHLDKYESRTVHQRGAVARNGRRGTRG